MSEAKPPMSDEQQAQVWHDNQRDVQIGGQSDGITPEVAEDIGYKPPKQTLEGRAQELEDRLERQNGLSPAEASELNAIRRAQRGGKPPLDPR